MVHDLKLNEIFTKHKHMSFEELTPRVINKAYKDFDSVVHHTLSADAIHSKCDASYCKVQETKDIKYKSDKHHWNGEDQPWPVNDECNAKFLELTKTRLSKSSLKALILGDKTKGTQALEQFHDRKARMLTKTISRKGYDFNAISNGALVWYNDGYEVLIQFTLSKFGMELTDEEKELVAVWRERQTHDKMIKASTTSKMNRKRKRVSLRKKEAVTDANEDVLYHGRGRYDQCV